MTAGLTKADLLEGSEMDSSDPIQEQALDPEWVELILLAKQLGYTIEEIRIFLTSYKSQNIRERTTF